MKPLVLSGLVALLLMPVAQAALNGDHPFEETLVFQGSGTAGSGFPLLSGSLDATLKEVRGPYGLFGIESARLTGLTRVCFKGECHTSPSGQLALSVSDKGSVGIRFPGSSSATARAQHVLGLLSDFSGRNDLNGLSMGKALVAPSIVGSFAFTRLPAIPTTTTAPDATGPNPNSGGLVTLDDTTRIEVFDGAQLKGTLTGRQDAVAFQGRPAFPEVHPDLMVLPFEAGSTAHMEPSPQEAADTGLDLHRIQGLLTSVTAANRAGGAVAPLDLSNLDPMAPLLPRLLNGAVLTLPTKQAEGGDGNALKQMGLVRFESLDAASSGSDVAVTGSGPLDVQGGEVAHAAPLVGFAIFQMPWWSYLLWGAAVILFVARLIVKPPQERPALDRFRWVGLVCSILLFLLFFWLWDMEVQAVWGISLLSGSASGEAFIVLAALELAPMFAVLFAVVAPIRVILRNGVLLARGGRLMGLPPAFAYPLGYIFGAPLLLAYLNVGLKLASGS